MSVAGLVAGGAWLLMVGGAVPAAFWALGALTLLAAAGAVVAAVRQRSRALLALAVLTLACALQGSVVALYAWAWSGWTF